MRPALLALIAFGAIAFGAPRPSRADSAVTEARHRIGFQLGGTNVLQIVYRLRIVDLLSVEAGGFMLPYAPVLGSIGLVAHTRVHYDTMLYVGAGLGMIVAASEYTCDLATEPSCTDRTDTAFVSARVGLSIDLGDDDDPRPARLGIDVGFWRGRHRTQGDGQLMEQTSFTLPMAGLSYLKAL